MGISDNAKQRIIKCLYEDDQGLCERRELPVMIFDGIMYDAYDESGHYVQKGKMTIGGWGLGDEAIIFKKNNVWYDDDDKKNECLSDWSLLIPISEIERIGFIVST
jgi:hypothetical protein